MYASSVEMNNSVAESGKQPAPNSLIAFLRAIKFRRQDSARSAARENAPKVERYFAQLTPKARRRGISEDACLVRSAN